MNSPVQEKIKIKSKLSEVDKVKLLDFTINLLVLYSFLSFIVGYIYIPGKNGGFHLSGFSTLIAISSILLFCYQLRKKLKTKRLYMISACLFFIAILLELTNVSTLTIAIYNGFVENLTLPNGPYLPSALTTNLFFNTKIVLVITMLLTMLLSFLAKESGHKNGHYLSMLFLIFFVFLFAVVFPLVQSISSINFGTVTMDYDHNVFFNQDKEPGKFVSIVLLQIMVIPLGLSSCFLLAKSLSGNKEESKKF